MTHTGGFLLSVVAIYRRKPCRQRGVPRQLAARSYHPVLRFAFAIVMIVLCLAAAEAAMRYWDRPRWALSGWRATETGGPVNQLGWRGRPWQPRRSADFIVVMTGAASVECLACPPGETLDLIAERALRRYNPHVQVITLGSWGYGQDQEYLALQEYFSRERADLVVSWAAIADAVPANTFRAGQPGPGRKTLKPSFALRAKGIVGPTEPIGKPVYKSKLSGVVRPLFIDIERNWTTLLPKGDTGAEIAPAGARERLHVDDNLGELQTPWSIWLNPRPARVQYGIDLTRALLRQMRELSILRGARFAIMLTPIAQETAEAPLALEHDGRWFLADPAMRDATIAQVTEGFDRVSLPLSAEDSRATSPEAERRIMARLADALRERKLLSPTTIARPRH